MVLFFWRNHPLSVVNPTSQCSSTAYALPSRVEIPKLTFIPTMEDGQVPDAILHPHGRHDLDTAFSRCSKESVEIGVVSGAVAKHVRARSGYFIHNARAMFAKLELELLQTFVLTAQRLGHAMHVTIISHFGVHEDHASRQHAPAG
jgi:hypothetical protein